MSDDQRILVRGEAEREAPADIAALVVEPAVLTVTASVVVGFAIER